jgi:hypothetical protein
VRYGVSFALLCAVLVAGGCSDDAPEPAATTHTATASVAPAYDESLEPSAAVLALVPEAAQTLTVTDFDQVRAELGLGELSDGSTPEEVAGFWQRADSERPLLSKGMLRPADPQLAAAYGFTQLDVAWEAHFADADGRELGWVLRFRDGTDMAKVAAAAQAPSSGGNPLAGAEVDAAAHLATSGTASEPGQSWSAEPELAELVGAPANSTFVARSCIDGAAAGAATEDVEELGAYSVQFQGTVVTARLGEGRHDLFARMRLGEQEPTFAAAYDGGVADPLTGRIGYVMSDPAAAAQLAEQQDLPFATCA